MFPTASHLRSAALGCALLLTGCLTYTIHGTVPPREPKTSAPADFRAGTDKVDITPIPGVPIGGIGPMAKISRGFWTRLYARALYLEDTQGDPLVLVVCDLPIIPSGLTDRVAELLSEKAGLEHIGLENLLLSATETHQGPGNYMTDKMHNVFDTPRAGFDSELFHFLSVRIVEAIRRAEQNAKAATLTKADGPLHAFFRNRSFEAFVLNQEAHDELSNSVLASCVPPGHRQNVLDPRVPHAYQDGRACKAVDPDVTLLKLSSASDPGEIVGLAVFLAVHPVVLTVETEVFSGDLFAVAANLLERPDYCAPGIDLPTVAIFNGAQGDVSAISEPRDRKQLLALGKKLADHVCGLLGTATVVTEPDISFRYGRTPELASQPVEDPDHRVPGFDVKTASEARPGAAQIAGAEEARTIFHDLGHREGLRRFVRNEHGMKSMPGQIDLGNIHHALIPRLLAKMDPPELSDVPMGVYQLGDVVLVSLPGEFTTTMGRRIRKHVAEKTGRQPKQVILVGLANGHTTYVTTPEEYDLQHYEGASSFFGAAVGPFFTKFAMKLASGLNAGSTAPEERSFFYEAGEERVFKPRGVGWPPYRADDGLANIVQSLGTRLPERDFPTFCWEDGVPRLGGHVHGDAPCNRHLPYVKVVTGGGVSIADNDGHGLDLVTVVAGVQRQRMEWCAIWMGAEPFCKAQQCGDLAAHPQCASDAQCLGPVHFEVDPVEGCKVTSASFPPTSSFIHRVELGALEPESPWIWKPWCLRGIDKLGFCSGTCEVQHP